MTYWTLGWDPSRRYHSLALVDENKQVVSTSTTDGIQEAIKKVKILHKKAEEAGFQLQLGIEATPYPVMDALFEQEFFPLYSLNAKKVNAYKTTHDLSGNKEDRADAISCAFYLMDFKHTLREYAPKSLLEKEAITIARELDLVRDEKTKAWERFWVTIAKAAPKLIETLNNPDANWFLEIMNDLPWRMKHTSFFAFNKACCKRGAYLVKEKLKPLYEELKTNGNKIDKNVLQSRVARLRLLRSENKLWTKRAGELLEEWDYSVYIMSIPGLAVKTAIRLFADLGENWKDLNVSKVSGYSGVAPIFFETGKSPKKTHRIRRHRYVCNKKLKTTLSQFARFSMIHNEWAHEAYKKYRTRGQEHWEAIRNLAIRWIRIMMTLVENQVFYNAEIHKSNMIKYQQRCNVK